MKIENIRHSGGNSVYDPHSRYYFDFIIKGIQIGMNNPFKLDSSNYSIDDCVRLLEFENKFKNPNVFFEMILLNLDSNEIQIVVEEELAEVDLNDYTEAYCGTRDDVVIQISKHRLIMRMDYITSKMKEYWL